MMPGDELQQLRADRDLWRARAEAGRRALRQVRRDCYGRRTFYELCEHLHDRCGVDSALLTGGDPEADCTDEEATEGILMDVTLTCDHPDCQGSCTASPSGQHTALRPVGEEQTMAPHQLADRLRETAEGVCGTRSWIESAETSLLFAAQQVTALGRERDAARAQAVARGQALEVVIGENADSDNDETPWGKDEWRKYWMRAEHERIAAAAGVDAALLQDADVEVRHPLSGNTCQCGRTFMGSDGSLFEMYHPNGMRRVANCPRCKWGVPEIAAAGDEK